MKPILRLSRLNGLHQTIREGVFCITPQTSPSTVNLLLHYPSGNKRFDRQPVRGKSSPKDAAALLVNDLSEGLKLAWEMRSPIGLGKSKAD
jgi:hypothetical protein